MAYIEIRTLPLVRDYAAGEAVVIVENEKEFRMQLTEPASAGARTVFAIPLDPAENG